MALKTFPNGLRLSVIEKENSKLTTVVVHIAGGTQSEKNYEAGISQFTSDMLLMGTINHPNYKELINFAKSKGVLISTDNTSESIVLSATTTNNVEDAIKILYEMTFDSLFNDKGGELIRTSLMSDIYKLNENSSYVLDRMINQALYYRTGLANPKFGTHTTVDRMTAQDSKEFLQRILTPKNTVISVVGNVNADEISDKIAETFYARFAQSDDYKKLKYVSAVEDFVGGERTKNKKLNQSRFCFAFPSVSYKSSKKYLMEIVAPVIQRRIKDRFARTSYFHTQNISVTNYANNGKFVIECFVDYDHVVKYMDTLVEILKGIVASGISDDEFENEKNAFIINFLKKTENVEELAVLGAKEVAINKQSYNQASELMKIDLYNVNDANSLIASVVDFSKLYITYLGNPANISASRYIEA